MIYFRETLDFKIEEPTVITFGKFDGLHRGHELLMETVLQTAKEQSCAPVVFTFDIPPKSMIAGQENKVLTTNEEKHFIFEQTGISYLIECPFTAQVRNMSPKDFIAWIVNSLSVTCIITGTDFRFGKDRMGDYHTLQQYEKEFGYKTIILDKIQEDGRDISSTFVREEIYKGNIEKANHLLGYDFFIKSTVVHGKALGRTIGIPTINMVVPKEKLLPPNGVYVTRVHIQDKCFPGVTNIGCKPTVSQDGTIGIETHILGVDETLYGQTIQVDFLRFIRNEQKFSSLDELISQMQVDIHKAEKYYTNITKIC